MKRHNRILAVVLALIMILGTVPSFAANEVKEVIASKPTFADMPTEGHWSYAALKSAVDNGLMSGSNGLLNPSNNMTRAEMAGIINNAFGAIDEADITAFTDVAKTDWFYSVIAKAVQMKTFAGSGNGLMNPTASIPRQDALVVIAKVLQLQSEDYSVLEKFADKALIAEYAKPYLAALVKAGYVAGSDGKIEPAKLVTREEVAQLLYNVFKTIITKAGTVTGDMNGNVLVNVPDVVLKDSKIAGDLIIADGVGNGDITLDNVEITGKLIVRGGGEHSIKIINKSIVAGDVVVAKYGNGGVRVYCDDTSKVEVIVVEDGKDEVKIEGAFKSIEVKTETPINLAEVKVEELNIRTHTATVTIESGNIETLTVEPSAKGSEITIAKDVTIATAVVDADAKIDSEGTIEKLDVKQNVELSGNVEETPAKTETPVTPPSGGGSIGGSSSSGGSSSEPDPEPTPEPETINAKFSAVLYGTKYPSINVDIDSACLESIKAGYQLYLLPKDSDDSSDNWVLVDNRTKTSDSAEAGKTTLQFLTYWQTPVGQYKQAKAVLKDNDGNVKYNLIGDINITVLDQPMDEDLTLHMMFNGTAYDRIIEGFIEGSAYYLEMLADKDDESSLGNHALISNPTGTWPESQNAIYENGVYYRFGKVSNAIVSEDSSTMTYYYTSVMSDWKKCEIEPMPEAATISANAKASLVHSKYPAINVEVESMYLEGTKNSYSLYLLPKDACDELENWVLVGNKTSTSAGIDANHTAINYYIWDSVPAGEYTKAKIEIKDLSNIVIFNAVDDTIDVTVSDMLMDEDITVDLYWIGGTSYRAKINNFIEGTPYYINITSDKDNSNLSNRSSMTTYLEYDGWFGDIFENGYYRFGKVTIPVISEDGKTMTYSNTSAKPDWKKFEPKDGREIEVSTAEELYSAFRLSPSVVVVSDIDCGDNLINLTANHSLTVKDNATLKCRTLKLNNGSLTIDDGSKIEITNWSVANSYDEMFTLINYANAGKLTKRIEVSSDADIVLATGTDLVVPSDMILNYHGALTIDEGATLTVNGYMEGNWNFDLVCNGTIINNGTFDMHALPSRTDHTPITSINGKFTNNGTIKITDECSFVVNEGAIFDGSGSVTGTGTIAGI